MSGRDIIRPIMAAVLPTCAAFITWTAVLLAAATSLARAEAPTVAGVAKQAPAKGDPKQDPAKGDPKQDPAKGDPKQDPAKGDPKQDPAKGDPKQDPAKGDPKQDPAKSDPKQDPAKGEAEPKTEPGAADAKPADADQAPSDADAALQDAQAVPPPPPDADEVPSDADAALQEAQAAPPPAADAEETPSDADAALAGEEPPAEPDAGQIGGEVASKDDVLKQLDEDKVEPPPATFDPLGFPKWRALNDKLDAKLGLRLGFTYYALFQYASSALGPRDAASGVFDFFGRWKPAGTDSIVGFNLRDRQAYTSIAPTSLDGSIGSIWRTARGFNDSGFQFNELWYDQKLADDRISFRVGVLNQKQFLDVYRFKSQKRYFLSTPFSDSPTIAFPKNGFGAVVRFSPSEKLHLTATIGDADGTGRVGFPGKAEFFTGLEVSLTPKVDDLRGRYSVTLWHADAVESDDTPSGRGFSLLFQQELWEGVVPFARYGYGDGADLSIEQLAVLGVGIEAPFGRTSDVVGVAGSWARPSDLDLRDQWGVEAFYRFQAAPRVQLTPGIQLLFDPSLNAEEDFIAVFEFRVGFVF